MVDFSGVDWASDLGSLMVALLVFEHEVFDCHGKLSWHQSLIMTVAVLSQDQLSESDRSRNLSLESELDEVKCVDSWELRVSLSCLAVDQVITKVDLECLLQESDLLIRGLTLFIHLQVSVIALLNHFSSLEVVPLSNDLLPSTITLPIKLIFGHLLGISQLLLYSVERIVDS